MDTRHVTIDIRKPDNAKLWSGTVRLAMDALDTEGQQALLDHGFAVREDSAVLEVVGEDEEKVNQAPHRVEAVDRCVGEDARH